MRLDEAAVWARVLIGATWGMSRETIRRYEIGAVPEERADPTVIAALAKVYEVPLDQLSPVVTAKVRKIMELAADVLGEGPEVTSVALPRRVPGDGVKRNNRTRPATKARAKTAAKPASPKPKPQSDSRWSRAVA